MRTVLLHGFTGYSRSFAHLDVDAVTPDLPGHNGAPHATSWEEALDRLEPLLRRLMAIDVPVTAQIADMVGGEAMSISA